MSQFTGAYTSFRSTGVVGAREAKEGLYPMESDLVVVMSSWYQGTTREPVQREVFGLLEKVDTQRIAPNKPMSSPGLFVVQFKFIRCQR